MSAFRKHLLSLVCLLGVSTAQGQDAAVKTTEAAPERQLQRCDSYYPLGGRAAGITVINFELTSKGGMNNVRVVRPSGNADLDSAAIKCASDFMPAWNMEDQHAISGGVVANDSAAVEWKQDGPSMLSFGCPYPILPLRLNQQGKIVLSLKILKDGTVPQPAVTQSSGFGDLDKAAVSCVRIWRFAPVLQQGNPVEFDWQTTVRFGIVD
ncbi:MAG TPA: TonB family protein [Rhizomicrobium sp.]|nr:TonB family protein [Rhizomicrobium sp.]